MPTNKNALLRYLTLDKCLRNTGRLYTLNDLIETCNDALAEANPESDGIRKRQLQDDLKFMRSEDGYGASIERIRKGKQSYYRYEDTNFSIRDQGLNDSEAKQMQAALSILSRFSGLPQFDWINELTSRLKSKFDLVHQEAEVISFEGNVDLTGREFITPLFNAIVNKRGLKVVYQDFLSPEPYELDFHPGYLKQYNNRWFVFGWNPAEKRPNWNLALDRIKSIHEVDVPYHPVDIDWEDYFYDIVGVTRPEDGVVENIVLQFDSHVAPYVRTKPLHPTQRMQELGDGLSVTIKVIPNFELAKLVLSFGDQVTVVEPTSFRKSIQGRLNQAVASYSK
ncbi:hypothetical protein LEM8419_00348 [Neolewinella maritima]|uniref:WYL domain-containing protein n=1 Tax=Neolewinella maritima TaxID=1383882 RepID=A0ABM9AX39_9BACT|nr:WYL domain-containing protein [Neolewinella maritima]CAH0999053.1 hypothetical protein LEM8419_00348 [Neolewinella maritima]